MNEIIASTLQIDKFHLRIPGLTPQEAHQLAVETVRRLAGRLPDRMTAQRLETLDLQLTVAPGTSRSRMAELMVAGILKRIV